MVIQLIHQQQWVFLGHNEFSRFLAPNGFPSNRHRISTIKLIPPTASSSSSSSFGASEYSGQLLDVEKKQARDRIAGVEQDELLDPRLLADPDSRFCEFKGLQIHHKVCEPESQAQNALQNQIISQLPDQTRKACLPMILLHGFGASLFSWNRVMKPLAELTGSKVLAFDRPAFGLTSRVGFSSHSSSGGKDTKSLNPYSMAFSVLATLYFIDFLVCEKAILVGHSAGSIVAIESYFEAPERVAALILIAPAILAPRTVHKVANANKLERDKQMLKDSMKSNFNGNPLIRFSTIFLKLSKYIAQAIVQLVKGMTDMIKNLYKKALSAVLRSAFAAMLVRLIINKFGIAAIRNAWYDSSQVTDHVLNGYTKPLKIKNWDKALVEYTATMLTDSESESKPPLGKRLHEISCPVLIVTGDSDRIVPSWNAERLSRVIPRSCLEVIKHCGHLPHEEKAEEFVSVVERFLRRFVYNSEEQCQQATT